MQFHRPHVIRLQARSPQPRDRVVVVTEDPEFWCRLRQEAPEIEASWMLAHTARECLLAVEDSRVQAVVLDGALNDKPANQLLHLLKQIRPALSIVFAFHSPNEEWEREARQAGVLYYGDRSGLADMVGVVRQCLHSAARPRPRPGELPARESRG
jgi:hypothetical protein